MLEALINAIHQFPDCIEVVGNALPAIDNIFSDECEPSKLMLRRFVSEMNGLDLVDKAMTQFSEATWVQAASCCLLHTIALEDELHGILIQERMVTAVSTALEDHTGDDEVKKYASLFLRTMARDL